MIDVWSNIACADLFPAAAGAAAEGAAFVDVIDADVATFWEDY